MENLYKILSLNDGNNSTLGGLFSILNLEKPHIVMLQEVTLSSEQLSLVVSKYGYKADTNVNTTDQTALGTGFVWKSSLPISEIYNVVECRSQCLKLGAYNFVNVYAPSGSQNKQTRRNFFGQDIFRVVRGLAKSAPIIGGDFNCILSSKDTENNFSDKKCPALQELVNSFNYTDAYRSLHPEGREYTFCRPSCAASRLDRFYLPQYLVGNLKSVTHLASLSDHKYSVMLVSLPDVTKLPEPAISSSPYWKLNTSILKDEDFLENFSKMYQKLQSKKSEFSDIALWWDYCAKPSIKKFCMAVSTFLSDIRNDTKKYIFSYLNVVLRKREWKEVARVRQEITEILQHEAMGFIVRSN